MMVIWAIAAESALASSGTFLQLGAHTPGHSAIPSAYLPACLMNVNTCTICPTLVIALPQLVLVTPPFSLRNTNQ